MNSIVNLKKKYPLVIGQDNPMLRATAQEVMVFDKDLEEYWEELAELMFEYDWVGLASPQIWKSIRVISVLWLEKKWKKYDAKEAIIMVNPKITYFSKETYEDFEWCLSLPGIEGDVSRSMEIEVEYQTTSWQKKKLRAKELNARIIQHEVDHLDWVLITDKFIKKSVDLTKFITKNL